jgi:3-deoxy-D-manno-octulosonic-acid transferase
MLIWWYGKLWTLLSPWVFLWLKWRVIKGKEIASRLPERYGRTTTPRSQGQVIWLHAASVGETVSAFVLGRTLFEKWDAWGYGSGRHLCLLITTSTVTAAKMLESMIAKHGLEQRMIHQMQPLDAPRVMRRFLHHWRPNVLISMESDIWPTMIMQSVEQDISVMLISAQMSMRSLKRWQRISISSRKALFSGLNRIEAVDEDNANRFRQIVAPDWTEIGVSGPLKASALPPEVDRDAVNRGNAAFNSRFVILLASSHPGEDELVLRAFQALRQSTSTVLILTPRHIERTPQLINMLETYDVRPALLSRDGWPDMQTSVCIADVMGQMGNLFTMADVIIMGGGFMPHGGHNPMEPAALGKGVISGKNIHKNAAIYARLNDFGGVIWADSQVEIESAITSLMTAPTQLKHLNSAAFSAYQSFTKQVDEVADRILGTMRPS